MPDNHNVVLDKLKDRIDRLKALYEKERDENSMLKKKVADLKDEIVKKDQSIKDLESRNTTLQITNSLITGENSHDTKLKINKILREIDKCIALLNK